MRAPLVFNNSRHRELLKPINCRAEFRDGFTLLEVMVAILILGIVLSSAFATVSQAIRTVELGRDYTRVAQVMQSEMEDLRTLSWNDLQELHDAHISGGGSAMWELTLSDDFVSMFGDRYTVWCVLLDRVAGQKEIWVWVWWRDSKGNWVSKRTSSWFTENGLHDYYYRSF